MVFRDDTLPRIQSAIAGHASPPRMTALRNRLAYLRYGSAGQRRYNARMQCDRAGRRLATPAHNEA
jgi:hypothetical protein